MFRTAHELGVETTVIARKCLASCFSLLIFVSESTFMVNQWQNT